MNSELEVLRDVVARLEGGAIPYMLTGSVAMSVYAEPRMTRDIDIVGELAAQDAPRVVALFAPDYYVSDEAVQSAISAHGLFNLFNFARLVKVDLLCIRTTCSSASSSCDVSAMSWVAARYG